MCLNENTHGKIMGFRSMVNSAGFLSISPDPINHWNQHESTVIGMNSISMTQNRACQSHLIAFFWNMLVDLAGAQFCKIGLPPKTRVSATCRGWVLSCFYFYERTPNRCTVCGDHVQQEQKEEQHLFETTIPSSNQTWQVEIHY